MLVQEVKSEETFHSGRISEEHICPLIGRHSTLSLLICINLNFAFFFSSLNHGDFVGQCHRDTTGIKQLLVTLSLLCNSFIQSRLKFHFLSSWKVTKIRIISQDHAFRIATEKPQEHSLTWDSNKKLLKMLNNFLSGDYNLLRKSSQCCWVPKFAFLTEHGIHKYKEPIRLQNCSHKKRVLQGFYKNGKVLSILQELFLQLEKETQNIIWVLWMVNERTNKRSIQRPR